MINLEHIVWKEGNHFVSQCVNVDVSSFGATKVEALENLKEALELYFEDGSLNIKRFYPKKMWKVLPE